MTKTETRTGTGTKNENTGVCSQGMLIDRRSRNVVFCLGLGLVLSWLGLGLGGLGLGLGRQSVPCASVFRLAFLFVFFSV